MRTDEVELMEAFARIFGERVSKTNQETGAASGILDPSADLIAGPTSYDEVFGAELLVHYADGVETENPQKAAMARDLSALINTLGNRVREDTHRDVNRIGLVYPIV